MITEDKFRHIITIGTDSLILYITYKYYSVGNLAVVKDDRLKEVLDFSTDRLYKAKKLLIDNNHISTNAFTDINGKIIQHYIKLN